MLFVLLRWEPIALTERLNILVKILSDPIIIRSFLNSYK